VDVKKVIEVYRNLRGFDSQKVNVLKEEKETLSQWADEIVKTFYDIVYGYEETYELVKDKSRDALEKTLREWYLAIVSGEIDEKFWEKQWNVGLIHIAARVSNVYFIAMMNTIREIFTNKTLETYSADKAKELINAFNMITNIIISLVVEGYIEAFTSLSGMDKNLVNTLAQLGAQEIAQKKSE
jgi:hypothetical protein